MRSHLFAIEIIFAYIMEKNNSILSDSVFPFKEIMLYILIRMRTINMKQVDRMIFEFLICFIQTHAEHMRILLLEAFILYFPVCLINVLCIVILRKAVTIPGVNSPECTLHIIIFQCLQEGKCRTSIITSKFHYAIRLHAADIIVCK